MVCLRKSTAQDQRPIRELIWRVGINPLGLDWRRFIVAVDEQDRLLGCGQIKPHGDGSRELASRAVRPERQREGIGSQISQRLLAENPLPLYLTCRASMEPYYQKFGFEAVGWGEMPPYLRRILRLFQFLRRFSPALEELRVMVKIT